MIQLVIVEVAIANAHLVFRVQVGLPVHIVMQQEIVEVVSVSALHLSVVMVFQQELIAIQLTMLASAQQRCHHVIPERPVMPLIMFAII